MFYLKNNEIDEFVEFNKKMYPLRRGLEESILYKLHHPYISRTDDTFYPIIVAKDKNERFIGQFQRIPCKYYIDGELFDAFWGMDYIVEEASRGSAAGVFLAKKALKDDHFGMGLSPISFKLHLLLGEKHISDYYKYIRFRSLSNLLKFAISIVIKHPLRSRTISDYYPNIINIGGVCFQKKSNPSDINWEFENNNYIEFSRDKEFLSWRFGSYPKIFTTYTYGDESGTKAYFIIRNVIWKGLPFLLLVDYKYRGDTLQPLLKAVSKILKKSHNYGIVTLSSFSDVDRALKHNRYIKFGSNGQIVTNIRINLSKQQIKQRKSIFVTFADSDADFFYGNKEWYEL